MSRDLRPYYKVWVALIALACTACGRGARGPESTAWEQNLGRPALPAEQVRLVESAGRPTLQLVQRKGDPSSAVAVAVLTPAGSKDALLLTALLKKRLQAPDGALHVRTHALGVVFATEVADPKAASRFMTEVAQALSTPVGPDEAAHLAEGALLRSAHARAGEPSVFGECMGQLGHEGADELLDELKPSERDSRAQRMERVRSSVVSAQVGLAALGDPAVLEAVSRAQNLVWPPAGDVSDSFDNREEIAVIESSGGRELRLALRMGDSDAALSAARALEHPDHPFRARLASLSSRFLQERTEVTLRPSGACLGMTVSFDSHAAAPTPERLAAASVLLLEEMRETARGSVGDQEKSYALLSPKGAIEAVGLAAWTAVHAPAETNEWKNVIEYRTPPNEELTPAALTAAVQKTQSAWKGRKLPVRTRDETGQAELWMMLASGCGTRQEPIDISGLRALTVTSLASQFDGLAGVRLLPWVGPEGVGLVAHAPAYRGEPSGVHARRVARALAAALSGARLDGRAVAESRAAQLERIGSDPGVELLFDILGGEHPSQLLPYGLERSVATLSLSDVERTRGDLVREPLRLAVLANGSPHQGEVARDALSRWLAPSRGQVEACSEPNLEVPPAKQWTLESIEDGVQSSAFVAVATQGPAELGHATSFLLNDGALIQALNQPGLVSSAHANFFGTSARGALVIHLGAEAEHMEAATQQVRGLLDRWSEVGSGPDQIRKAAQMWNQLREQSARTPEGRLVELWVEPQQTEINAQSLHIFQKQLGATAHRVVFVKKRK